MLKAIEAKHVDYSDNSDALLHVGSEAYRERGCQIDIIYGDYFYMEAIFKLSGSDFNLW